MSGNVIMGNWPGSSVTFGERPGLTLKDQPRQQLDSSAAESPAEIGKLETAMSHRLIGVFAVPAVLLIALATGACADNDELRAGCTPPSNEQQLLDTFRDDPVFQVNPPAARRIDGPSTSNACRVLNREDTSSTSVTLSFELTRNYAPADLNATYDQDMRGRGWIPVIATGPTPMQDTHLQYCKVVQAVPSFLSIDSSVAGAPELRASASAGVPAPPTPAGVSGARLVVSIVAMPDRPCPPAAP